MPTLSSYLVTSFPNCLKIRVAMKPIDQTDKEYRLNIGQNFGNIYSISMVIIQLKLIANNRAVKYQRGEEFI